MITYLKLYHRTVKIYVLPKKEKEIGCFSAQFRLRPQIQPLSHLLFYCSFVYLVRHRHVLAAHANWFKENPLSVVVSSFDLSCHYISEAPRDVLFLEEAFLVHLGQHGSATVLR